MAATSAVAAEADEALAVDLDLDHHLAGARAHEHEVVDRVQRLVAVALDARARAARAAPVAGRDAVERVVEPVGGHRGERAEAAAGDAEHGRPDRRGGVQRGERRAVAAERDHEVAVGGLAGRRHLALVRGDLHDLGALALGPLADRRERAVELPPRVDREPDAVEAVVHGGRFIPGRLSSGAMADPLNPALRAVSDAVLAVAAQRSVEDVLQQLVDSARELAGARYAALGTPDGEGGFTRFLVAGMSDELIASLGPLPRTHGHARRDARDARAVPDRATSTSTRASAAGGRRATPTCARSSACRSSRPRA